MITETAAERSHWIFYASGMGMAIKLLVSMVGAEPVKKNTNKTAQFASFSPSPVFQKMGPQALVLI